jgi:dTDP-4-dehydrorhamnose 3,5-epimerase
MEFIGTRLHGVYVVRPTPVGDARGFFARTFCEREFGERGLETRFVQHSKSRTGRRGTIRGMHFQRAPHEEVKLIACSRGAIFDVLVDIRPDSPTRWAWQGFELSAENGDQLYAPAGVAHGFQSLTDDVEVNYRISAFYAPEASTGVRHDDPAFGIRWPLPLTDLSEKDARWPDFVKPQP